MKLIYISRKGARKEEDDHRGASRGNKIHEKILRGDTSKYLTEMDFQKGFGK